MQSAHQDGDSGRAVTVGEFVGFFDLRGETRNRHHVKITRQFRERAGVRNFDIADFNIRGCHACQREQAEAG